MSDFENQPITGDDGELVEADTEANPRDYENFVDAVWETGADMPDAQPPRQWRSPEYVLLFAVPLCFVILMVVSGLTRQVQVVAEAHSDQTPVPSAILQLPAPGETSISIKGRWGNIQGIGWSANNHQIGILTVDNRLYIWDFYRGQQITFIPFDAEVFDWLPQSSNFAISINGQVDLRDGRSGGELRTLVSSADIQVPSALKFSPDGTQLVIVSFDWLWMVDVATGNILHMLTLPNPIETVKWSPDNKRLFLTAGQKLYYSESGKLVEIPVSAATWVSADVSPDGQRLAVGYDTPDKAVTIGVLDISSNQLIWSSRVSSDPTHLNKVAWSPTGNTIASFAENESTLIVWNSQNGQTVQGLMNKDNEAITSLDWSADGKYLAFSSASYVTIRWMQPS